MMPNTRAASTRSVLAGDTALCVTPSNLPTWQGHASSPPFITTLRTTTTPWTSLSPWRNHPESGRLPSYQGQRVFLLLLISEPPYVVLVQKNGSVQHLVM